MAKLSLSDLANITGNEASAITTINANSALIETALENTLSRDGTSPNSMGADLDLNGYDIINAGNIQYDGDVITSDTVTNYVDWTEIATPSSPAANKIRTFAVDSSGTTKLVAKDSSGTTHDLTHFTQSGTGATLRTQEAKLRDAFSVKDFGAVADNSTNDASAIQACFTAAIAANKAVYIPAGTYFLSDTGLTWSGAACRIVGDGIGVTVLRWNGSSGGIAITQSNDDYFTHVSDMSLWQSGVSLGTALSYDGSGQKSGGIIQNRTSPRIRFSNLSIRGTTNSATDGWNKHIDVNNGKQVLVEGVHVEGKYLTTLPNIQSASAFHFRGDGAPVEIVVRDCWSFFTAETILAEDCEGLFVDHCNFVAVGKGVNFNPAAAEPQLCLTNTHINAYVNCVKAVQLAQGQILNNLFYSRDDATGNVILAQFGTNCDNCHISHNTFVKTSVNTDTGLEFGGASSSTNNLIHCNIFKDVNIGVSLPAGSVGTEVTGNIYDNVATPFSDSGSSTFRHNDGHSGTAALPAWSFKGDENTGIYRIGADQLGISTGGVNALTIGSDRSVKAVSATGGLGYGTGAGSTATQATSKTTTVAINTVCGEITMNNAALAGGGTIVAFAVTNTSVAANDNVIINHASGGTGGAYRVSVDSIAAGSFAVRVSNVSGGSLSEAIVLRFTVIKGVVA